MVIVSEPGGVSHEGTCGGYRKLYVVKEAQASKEAIGLGDIWSVLTGMSLFGEMVR